MRQCKKQCRADPKMLFYLLIDPGGSCDQLSRGVFLSLFTAILIGL